MTAEPLNVMIEPPPRISPGHRLAFLLHFRDSLTNTGLGRPHTSSTNVTRPSPVPRHCGRQDRTRRASTARAALRLPKNLSDLVGAGVGVQIASSEISRTSALARLSIVAEGWSTVLLRLGYLAVTHAFAMLRLLPMSDRDKDAEILALRHQLMVLERQLGEKRVRFTPSDRAFLAAVLYRLPRDVLGRLRLVVRPDTVLR